MAPACAAPPARRMRYSNLHRFEEPVEEGIETQIRIDQEDHAAARQLTRLGGQCAIAAPIQDPVKAGCRKDRCGFLAVISMAFQ